MGKKRRKATYDFEVAVQGIIPASEKERSDDKTTSSIKAYQKSLVEYARKKAEVIGLAAPFPRKDRVVATVIQFMTREKECWEGHDVDNLAKTVLDPLERIVYESDAQVQLLLSAKTVIAGQPNMAYIAVKRIPTGTAYDDLLKAANVEHALEYCRRSFKVPGVLIG